MERRFSELWPEFVPAHPEDDPDPVCVATYTAVVDADIVRAELRFNEVAEGSLPPGLAGDPATIMFVRSLVQGDLRRRIVALAAEQ